MYDDCNMYEDYPRPSQGCRRHVGVVITPQLAGPFVGAIYETSERRVYLMPRRLFEFDIKTGNEQKMSISKMQKLEELYSFGDYLCFDANALRIVEQVIGRAQQQSIPRTCDNRLTLKTTGCISKNGEVWTSEFGILPYRNVDKRPLPLHDVPVELFIEPLYESSVDPFATSLEVYKFGKVDVDNKGIVYNAPWNAKQKVPCLLGYSDDEDDQPFGEVPALESDDRGSGMKYNVKGILFDNIIYSCDNPMTEYVRALPRDRLEEGTPNYLPSGTLVHVDAYYSDLHDKWIVFSAEQFRERLNQPIVGPPLVLFPPRTDCEALVVTAELEPVPDVPGLLVNKHLFQVVDRRGIFCTLLPALTVGEHKAEIVFLGLAPNRVANFEVLVAHHDLRELHQYERVIEGKGFVIGKEIVCPKYISTYIVTKWQHTTPVGTPVKFEAILNETEDQRITYFVTFFEPIAGAEKYDLEETEVDGEKALICSVYRQHNVRTGTFWLSPLLGVVEDVKGVLNRVSNKRGCRVVVRRDSDFTKASTMFYIHELLPNVPVKKMVEAVGCVEEML